MHATASVIGMICATLLASPQYDILGAGAPKGSQLSLRLFQSAAISVDGDIAAANTRQFSGRSQPIKSIKRRADGIWISKAELQSLPTKGKAWKALLSAAELTGKSPNISDQNDRGNVRTLAQALVAVRNADARLAAQARQHVLSAIGTEENGRTLAIGRNLAALVIAAELVGLSKAEERRFRAWLRSLLTKRLDGRTLRETHELRPNNWGTMAGASRAAIAVYLADAVEIQRTAKVFHGWLGDRTAYAGFEFGRDVSWHADPAQPRGINPRGARIAGHDVGGALPDDMRRGGSFAWPAQPTGYPWGALQGAVVQAEILYRAGYDSWEWNDRALLRAVGFLYRIDWKAEGDDEWIVWLIDARYGTQYAKNQRARPGKVMGWTSWTHSRRAKNRSPGKRNRIRFP